MKTLNKGDMRMNVKEITDKIGNEISQLNNDKDYRIRIKNDVVYEGSNKLRRCVLMIKVYSEPQNL